MYFYKCIIFIQALMVSEVIYYNIYIKYICQNLFCPSAEASNHAFLILPLTPSASHYWKLYLMGMNFKKDLSTEFDSILSHRKQGRGDKRPHNPNHTVVHTQSSRCPSQVELKPFRVYITLSPRLCLSCKLRFRKILGFTFCLTWQCFLWLLHQAASPDLGHVLQSNCYPGFPLRLMTPLPKGRRLILALPSHCCWYQEPVPKELPSTWGDHLQQTKANSRLCGPRPSMPP